MNTYKIQGVHFVDRLKLKDVRDRLPNPPESFSNYELVIKYAQDSYAFIFHYGSAVFFNVPDDVRERELQTLHASRGGTAEIGRSTDVFSVEVSGDGGPNRIFFDRVVLSALSFAKIRIVCMLLAESTALDYYEELIEKMLDQTTNYSRKLEKDGKLLTGGGEFIKYIGQVLSTKQEIISNLYIVDSPDETWEDSELDKLHAELKTMLEIDTRYRALDYKTRIIQESLEIFVDLSKSRRETLLELVVILLIAVELILSLIKELGHR